MLNSNNQGAKNMSMGKKMLQIGKRMIYNISARNFLSESVEENRTSMYWNDKIYVTVKVLNSYKFIIYIFYKRGGGKLETE